MFLWLYFFLQAENKIDRTYIPELLDDMPHIMKSLSEVLRKNFAPVLNFPPLLEIIDDLKTFLEAFSEYIGKYLETTSAEIKDYEEKLSGVMERITHLEKPKGEL